MNLQPVKTPEGRRLRDPRNGRVLPSTADPGSGLRVDLDDPHWHRALGRGDIVVVEAVAPSASTGGAATLKPAAVPTTSLVAVTPTSNAGGAA